MPSKPRLEAASLRGRARRRLPQQEAAPGRARQAGRGEPSGRREQAVGSRAAGVSRPHQVAELRRLLAVVVQPAQGAGTVLVHPQAHGAPKARAAGKRRRYGGRQGTSALASAKLAKTRWGSASSGYSWAAFLHGPARWSAAACSVPASFRDFHLPSDSFSLGAPAASVCEAAWSCRGSSCFSACDSRPWGAWFLCEQGPLCNRPHCWWGCTQQGQVTPGPAVLVPELGTAVAHFTAADLQVSVAKTLLLWNIHRCTRQPGNGAWAVRSDVPQQVC